MAIGNYLTVGFAIVLIEIPFVYIFIDFNKDSLAFVPLKIHFFCVIA